MSESTRPDDWRLIEPLLDGVLDRPPEERAAFLREVCEDPDIRRRVEELVREEENGTPLIEVPAYERFARLLAQPVAERVPELLSGRYRIEREIGRGGMAVVYLAADTRYEQRQVAVKVLTSAVSAAVVRDRFISEVQTAARLSHPNIVPLYDSDESDGFLYYVMPFVDGDSLRIRLERERPIPIPEALRISAEVAEALRYAHGQGVVHRDIKPDNILLAAGHALVCDFGIALALQKAGGQRLTDTGVIIGTVQYMSPEQATSDPLLDARSDIYSLGCVLYEMLAGEPPFTGATRQQIVAQHISAPVPSLSIVRSTVSSQLEHVISTALAKVPADRHSTIDEFASAINGERERISSPTTVALPAPKKRWSKIPRKWLVGSTVVMGLTAAATVRAMFPELRELVTPATVAMDTTRLVLLPLEGARTGGAAWRDEDLLQEGLARWRGVKVVDQFQVTDALRQQGGIHRTADAMSLASSLDAGRYIRWRLSAVGNQWRVSASLYDAARGQPLYSVSQIVPNDVWAATTAYASLADSLLLRGAPADSVPLSTVGSRSLPAVQAFGRAQLALDDWDLALADSLFQAAVKYDPEYARASLWLAQVRAWQDRSSTSWQTVAQRAVALGSQLNDRESLMAAGLILLANHSFEEACSVYDRLVHRNDRDFAGWFGLGQCQLMNRLVYPNQKSPSGWSFHSSAHRAMTAYGRAFEILPAVHRGYERGAFSRLRRILLGTTDVIIGYSAIDSSQFYARAGWIGDTLALIPFPWRDVATGQATAIPPNFATALANRREAFRRIAAGWSAAYPGSSGSKYAVAIALEMLGDPTAIDTIRLARRLTTDSVRRRQLAAAEVLLLVKFGLPERVEFLRTASALADSLLSGANQVSAPDAEIMTQIAMLVGACKTAEELAVRLSQLSTAPAIGPQMFTESQALLARVGTGCQASESRVKTFAATLERELRSEAPDKRAVLVDMWASRPIVLASGRHPEAMALLAATSDDPFVRAQWAYARGKVDSARALFQPLRTPIRDTLTPPTPDITFPKARLAVALGDTAYAIERLDRTLAGVRRYDPRVLSENMRTGPLVQSMLLRAELALASGDTATGRRWATPVSILWSHAGAELQVRAAKLEKYADTARTKP